MNSLQRLGKIYLTLPSPPSLNQLYGHTRTGQTYKKPMHRKYLGEVQKLCKIQHQGKPLDCALYVELRWYRPARRGDVDRCLKTMLMATKSDNIKVDLDIRVNENSAVTDLRTQLAQMAATQTAYLQSGTATLQELGAMKPRGEYEDAEVE